MSLSSSTDEAPAPAGGFVAGMAMGVGTYLGTKALGGRAREVSCIMWAVGVVFFLRYLLLPVD